MSRSLRVMRPSVRPAVSSALRSDPRTPLGLVLDSARRPSLRINLLINLRSTLGFVLGSTRRPTLRTSPHFAVRSGLASNLRSILRSGLALLLLVTLLPTFALGAGSSITLADYQAELRQGVEQLEQADNLIRSGRSDEGRRTVAVAGAFLSGRWRVETPQGPVESDLTDLNRLIFKANQNPNRYIRPAIDLAREHLDAAEAFGHLQSVDVPGARDSLEQALRKTEARSALQRVRDWFLDLLGRPGDRAVETSQRLPEPVYYVGGGLAAAALAWLTYSLFRSLSSHGAGGGTALKAGRAGPSDRPLTPTELRQRARALSQEGDQLEAVRTAHLALLLRYDVLKLIRYRPAQTNREHERQLRRGQPQLAHTFHSLNDLVDDRLYSGHEATAADYLTVDALVGQLWREGDATSRSAEAIPGGSSSASSS